MEKDLSEENQIEDNQALNTEQFLEDLLQNPTERERLARRLGVRATGNSHVTLSGTGGGFPIPSTLSGKDGGGSAGSVGGQPPPRGGPPFWWPPVPHAPAPYGSFSPPGDSSTTPWPFPWFGPYPSQNLPLHKQASAPAASGSETPASCSSVSPSEEQDEEDRVDLLSESEALELVEFNPEVEPEDAWTPPSQMDSFFEKHFNRSLATTERKAILKDFPKPASSSLQVPKLDEQVKEHIKGKGKDPHFGQEKSLYRIQEAVLDVSAPLACLWGDLLNEEAKYSKQDLLMLIQRSLVLLGSASHAISQERRKVAWARINPKLKSLAEGEYDKRDSSLFGPGFLEKASKKLEVDKTIRKVSQTGAPPPKRARFSKDSSDLRHFLDKGATARYGGGRFQRQQPYQPPKRFQSKKYFHQSRTSQSTPKTQKSDSSRD